MTSTATQTELKESKNNYFNNFMTYAGTLSTNPPSMIILTLITISIIAIVLIGIAFDRL